MADRHRHSKKNESNAMESSSAKSKPHMNRNHQSPTSIFHRSMTIHHHQSPPSSSTAIITNKPLANIYDGATTFQRIGSVKGLHGPTHHHPSPSSSFLNSILKSKVRKLRSIFEKHHNQDQTPKISPQKPASDLPGTEDRVVIYYTSLRGVRKTFQDCHSVRMIFRGFRVNVDERDVSMDFSYRKDLQTILGKMKQKNDEAILLPQVFVKGRYVGGADVVKQLLEMGELGKMLKGIPLSDLRPCDACGDARFLPCDNCSGSRKLFEEDEGEYKRCLVCNENGLVRCPLCCY